MLGLDYGFWVCLFDCDSYCFGWILLVGCLVCEFLFVIDWVVIVWGLLWLVWVGGNAGGSWFVVVVLMLLFVYFSYG